MTDKDLEKAIDICATATNKGDYKLCIDCPLFPDYKTCKSTLIVEMSGYIQRHNATIKRWKNKAKKAENNKEFINENSKTNNRKNP